MSLLAFFDEVDKDEVKSLIKRYRGQMVLHSYLYYVLDKPIWSDDKWQEVADKLTQLQVTHPDCCKVKYYDKQFADWSGDTGMHLDKSLKVQLWANYILRVNDEQTKN